MYKIQVKIDGLERRKKSVGLLHLLAGFFILLNASTSHKSLLSVSIFSFLLMMTVAVISLLYGLFRKKWESLARFNFLLRLLQFLTFFVLGIYSVKWGNPLTTFSLFLWAFAALFLVVAERKVFQPSAIELKEDGIHIPGYFTNHVLPWHQIQHFILRPDFVTITRTNTKYVQLELSAAEHSGEEIINGFARQKIKEFQLISPPLTPSL
jgi:hypothetical protein